MRPFTYARPTDLDAAQTMLQSDPGARFIAGGTNLVDLLKLGVATTDHLIDLSHLLSQEMRSLDDGGFWIGAGANNAALAGNRKVRTDYPLLAQALLAGASGQIRNVATVGGNLLQRTRCVYFQDTTRRCNKRAPGSGCAAQAGPQRDFALFGRSEECIATYPGDMAVALTALDAQVHIQRGNGTSHVMPVADLHRLPGNDPQRDTVLERDDVILGVELPPPLLSASSYRKVRDRQSYAFALVSVAAAIKVTEGRVDLIRLAFGGVAARPWRARVAEEALIGASYSREAVVAALTQELESTTADGGASKSLVLRSVASSVIDELVSTDD